MEEGSHQSSWGETGTSQKWTSFACWFIPSAAYEHLFTLHPWVTAGASQMCWEYFTVNNSGRCYHVGAVERIWEVRVTVRLTHQLLSSVLCPFQGGISSARNRIPRSQLLWAGRWEEWEMAKTCFRIWEQRLWEPARWQGQASLRVLSVLFGSSVLPFFLPQGIGCTSEFYFQSSFLH